MGKNIVILDRENSKIGDQVLKCKDLFRDRVVTDISFLLCPSWVYVY